jgi:4-aminobutyrate aminotransferase-like enzyme
MLKTGHRNVAVIEAVRAEHDRHTHVCFHIPRVMP